MPHQREKKESIYSIIGGSIAILAVSLIIILFFINAFVGNIGPVSDYLLYYFVPLCFILSLLLLSVEIIKRKLSRRRFHRMINNRRASYRY